MEIVWVNPLNLKVFLTIRNQDGKLVSAIQSVLISFPIDCITKLISKQRLLAKNQSVQFQRDSFLMLSVCELKEALYG